MKKFLLGATIIGLLTSPIFAKSSEEFNPFTEIQKMQEQMDKIFEEFHKKMMSEDAFSKFKSFDLASSPAMDLVDKKDHYEIKVDMPGVDEKGVKITVKERVLKIEAKREQTKKEKKDNFIKQERFFSDYLKMITLPKDANADKLKSSYKNGVLTIVIPKK